MESAVTLIDREAGLDPESFDALLVDLDGVVTCSASLHAAAWKRLFDEFLAERAEQDAGSFRPFDIDQDYRIHVDGKPRLDGLRDFLASRGIVLPLGRPDDPPDRDSLQGLSKRKNAYFRTLVDRDGVPVIAGSLAFLKRARSLGWKTAVVSSSKNCSAILHAAGLEGLFDEQVDGRDLEDRGLPGKPAPDSYSLAAERLAVAPERAVVIEDALVGVRAGRAGRFGLVIGIGGEEQKPALLQAGADIVVADLSRLAIDRENDDMAQEAPPNALEAFDSVTAAAAGRDVALFLDYDGTLTPIVARPELAVLQADMRRTLDELSRKCTVAIVSGRDRKNVEELVQLEGLYYAGSHGFDISGPSGRRVEHEEGTAYRPVLAQAEQELREGAARFSGALIEGKTFAVSAHYRLVEPEQVDAFHDLVQEVAGKHPELRVTGGKKVWELRPRIDWDKGRAVLWLLDTLQMSGERTLPIYIGDDVTDEDAFVRLSGGIGVLVADEPHPTAARYLLRDIGEVREFLERLSTMLSGPAQ